MTDDEFILKLRGTEKVLVAQFKLPIGESLKVNDGAGL